MEPRIQYAQTEDGVSIAYWTMGEGPPLVHMPADTSLSHIQLEWQVPAQRRWYQRLAEKRMVVRYDGRGTGLSDRDVSDYSLDACVLDLKAVVEDLNLEKFALYVPGTCGPLGITYAAAHPERVENLILWCSHARFSDLFQSKRIRALEALMDVDWETATETWARVSLGGTNDEQAGFRAAFMRESTTMEAMRAFIEANRDVDVGAVLPDLKSQTLVLYRRDLPDRDSTRLAKDLASRIPDARLLLLEGSSNSPFLGDTDAVIAAIDEFLGEGEETAVEAEPPAAGGLVTILFTDMESSTALTQRLGDAKAQELVRAHNTIVRDALKAHGGSEIKHTGDGIMASFPSASGALECAVQIQRAVEKPHAEPVGASLRIRIGLNAGEPVAEEQDLFGASVQLARRVCDQAEPGQIVASNVVRELATGKGFLFSDLGDVVPKGFEDPVRLYEVRWRES